MSRPRPITGGRARPVNLVVLLREAYLSLNDLVPAWLAERGHGAVRPAHSAVFQYLDDTGTTVSRLAERAQMTKQAMAELVAHLEAHGYVDRVPDPADARSRLVVPTARGREVVAVAQELVPELDQLLGQALGAERLRDLRRDLVTIQQAGAGVNRERPAAAPGRPRRRTPPASE